MHLIKNKYKKLIGVVCLYCLVVNICLYFSFDFFSTAQNDADYYDDYALGAESVPTSSWPIILYWLNKFGFYNRDFIAFLIYLVYIYIAFFLLGRIVYFGFSFLDRNDRVSIGLVSAIYILCYPTLLAFTTDIFREIFMLFVFLLCIYSIELSLMHTQTVKKFFFVSAFVVLVAIEYSLRNYLAVALIFALPFSYLKLGRTNVLLCILIYFSSISVLFNFGLFDELLAYRNLYALNPGSSGFGIDLLKANLGFFIFGFLQSFSYQIFGLYFTNNIAVAIFLVETIPFLLALTYAMINRRYTSRFESYLLCFALIYGTLVTLTCDNLGTALRLRIFVYISVAIVFGRTWLLKRRATNF